MNVGIIIFSRTGNTLSVAEKIRDACIAQGHNAVIERVTAENDDPKNKQPLRLKTAPVPLCYDAVIFGAPVEGFSLSLVMKVYLEKIPQVTGKKIYCFVTQHFPKPWMGGNQAIRQMCRLCRTKGGDVAGTGIVNWTSKSRDAQMRDVTTRLGEIK